MMDNEVVKRLSVVQEMQVYLQRELEYYRGEEKNIKNKCDHIFGGKSKLKDGICQICGAMPNYKTAKNK